MSESDSTLDRKQAQRKFTSKDDLTGEQFGMLSVIRRAKKRGHHNYWVCACQCGVEKEVRLDHLNEGRVVSCGCRSRLKISNGDRFSKWTVLREGSKHYGGDRRWWCRCDCGNERLVFGSMLNSGGSTRCASCRKVTHGMCSTSTYKTYQKMLERCLSKNSISYPNYGGRGISVCDRWAKSFEAFYEDMGEKPEGLSIERIDNSKGYFPGNCRWATAKEQARNKRNNHFVEHDGQRKCLAEWAEATGIPASVIATRIRSGYSPERALTEPAKGN